jgi:uncharacterized cupin superfamily protein
MSVTHSMSNAESGTYTPFAVNGDRDPFGALKLLDIGETRLTFGMWRCPPATVEVTPRSDEGVYVVSGTMTLAVDNAPPSRLGPGDLVLIRHGSLCRYTVLEDLVAVFASARP